MSRYHWRVVGIEHRPHPTTLVRLFDDEGDVEAEHVGHVVEMLGGVNSVVDWSMVDTGAEVEIAIKRVREVDS
jgi:hypothetical protein